MVEGWKWREDREWERAAWMVALLLRPYTKQPLKVTDLLPQPVDADAPEKPGTFKDWLAQAQTKQDALRGASRGDR